MSSATQIVNRITDLANLMLVPAQTKKDIRTVVLRIVCHAIETSRLEPYTMYELETILSELEKEVSE